MREGIYPKASVKSSEISARTSVQTASSQPTVCWAQAGPLPGQAGMPHGAQCLLGKHPLPFSVSPCTLLSLEPASLHCVSCRLESGGSDTSTERPSARARREAREARLATLSSRAEDDGGRDYRKVGSYPGPPRSGQPCRAPWSPLSAGCPF